MNVLATTLPPLVVILYLGGRFGAPKTERCNDEEDADRGRHDGRRRAVRNIAPAYVVEVTTTVSIPCAVNSDDTKPLDEAIKSAVQDVLDHAIGFTPAVVGLEDAKVVGDRLYLRLLIADEKDRATVDGLLNDDQPEAKPNERDDREVIRRPQSVGGKAHSWRRETDSSVSRSSCPGLVRFRPAAEQL